MRRIHCIAVLACLVASLPRGAAAAPPDFTKDIAPLFTKHCTGCHNDQDREGKLSLESFDALLKGGAKGSVITPGQPELSRLVRVVSGQAEPKMPPEGEEPLQPAQIELLKAWIAAGANGPSGAVAEVALVTPEVKLLAPPKLAIHAVALAPAGDLLAIARHGDVELQVLPERTTLTHLSGIRGSVNGVAFSRDGKYLVAAAGEPGLFGEARLYVVADTLAASAGRADGAQAGRGATSASGAEGASGPQPASGGTPGVPAIFRGHKDSLYCVALSPDGRMLATGSYDSTIKLWDVASGKELRTLEGHNGAVFELAFRPDGQVLASASGDRTVKLWNVATGARLDTLKESLKELYTLAFSPDGSRLAAAGVDNRIRVWRIMREAKEGTNPLLHSIFAHETPVLRVVWSPDGQTIVSSGEDRLVKVWNADTMTIRRTLPRQSDWASGLAVTSTHRPRAADGGNAAARGPLLVVGRVDGTLGIYEIPAPQTGSERPPTPLPEVPPAVDYGPQPPIELLPRLAEVEPNDQPTEAGELPAPGVARGTVARARLGERDGLGASSSPGDLGDVDLYRFSSRAGEQWILETKAARDGSPLDTKLEILDTEGRPVPRLLLRAVRDSVIEFRGMNSEQRGVRLANWEEMLLNEYVYLSGDVIKLFQQRRGPDADAQFYPENGNRYAFLDTTPRAHALGEPAYIVVPYAVGTELPNNGLPVFTLYYENDDDAQRKLGKDSRLTFVAPADGTYLVRVSDVRGFGGDDYKYELTIRRPEPDFSVAVAPASLTVSAGSGKPFTVKAERIDNFHGPIRVEIHGLPADWEVTSPILIQEGLYEAQGLLTALPGAAVPTDEQLAEIKFTAAGMVCGQERVKQVAGFKAIKLGPAPKVLVHLELPSAAAGEASGVIPEVTIVPGERTVCKLRVERRDFKDRIAFDVANLPHGVIVDDIGLSGVLIPEGQTERTIFLRAEPWVPEQLRLFFATAQVDGNQCSRPMLLRVVPGPATDSPATSALPAP